MFNKNYIKRQFVELRVNELIKFIKKEFPYEGQDYVSHNNKIQVLKSLSHSDLSAIIARMSRIEIVHDITKTVSLITAVLSAITLVMKFVFGEGMSYTVLFALYVSCIAIAGLLDRRKHIAATYFKDLVIRIKEDKVRDEQKD
ncbi:hypothetical protein CHR37_04620 [Bacillus velezensis]|uniref:Uncharacterized protein n=1 Tax=Bacillus velezensis TaxID=492670 RepID=A0ABC8DA54_BACVE|nr:MULTISPECIES: hypothetical protein [Bacillus]ANB49229.1 hypothetical protein A1D33_018240 [Bacillus velezensis]AVI29040.1 hypothetical protein C3Z10_11905 [Bacillus velezensis]AWX72695.1 hypothetical protein BVDSYZ_11930 [Bacillus velezensis]KJR69328.1 hypothetical protein BAGR45_10785 [Bacillus velezensis]MBR7816722.1 hypothetical protein [Bacillus sp. CCNWLCWHY013]